MLTVDVDFLYRYQLDSNLSFFGLTLAFFYINKTKINTEGSTYSSSYDIWPAYRALNLIIRQSSFVSYAIKWHPSQQAFLKSIIHEVARPPKSHKHGPLEATKQIKRGWLPTQWQSGRWLLIKYRTYEKRADLKLAHKQLSDILTSLETILNLFKREDTFLCDDKSGQVWSKINIGEIREELAYRGLNLEYIAKLCIDDRKMETFCDSYCSSSNEETLYPRSWVQSP